MRYNLMPRFTDWPSLFFEETGHLTDTNGLTLSEDENHVYVEAALPGVTEDVIDLSYDKGTLWIRAEKKEEKEDKAKKYYKKAIRSFSYHVQLPHDVDESKEPEAVFKNGVIHVTLKKKQKGALQKIPVKKG